MEKKILTVCWEKLFWEVVFCPYVNIETKNVLFDSTFFSGCPGFWLFFERKSKEKEIYS